tara:strand:+ start:3930 stop:4352 length:423 start_codon:yes stop_codon:yes gene_type:complete
MNRSKQADLKYGLSMEQRNQPELEKVFGTLHNNNDENKYSHIDFKNDKFGVEYKRRMIKFGQYKTLFFEMFKVKEARKYIEEGKRVFFCWHCNDDKYVWEFNEDQWFSAWGGRRDRGKIEESDLCNVNLEYIKPLSTLSF